MMEEHETGVETASDNLVQEAGGIALEK